MKRKIHCLFLFLLFACATIAQSKSTSFITDTKNWQTQLNEDYLNPLKSPLSETDRNNFTTHQFFEIDSNFVITGKLVQTYSKIEIPFATTTGNTDIFYKYADIYFSLLGVKYNLPVYQSKNLLSNKSFADLLFFPFTDLTNGTLTYTGGRYIDLKIPKGTSKIVINFNKAYSPYCAYSNLFACPKVPLQNHLPIQVLAGVKYIFKNAIPNAK